MPKPGRALGAVLLVAALVLGGCGGDKKALTEIGETVTTFMNSALALDIEAALACVDEDSDYYKECSENGPLGLSAEALDPAKLLGDDVGTLLGDSGDEFVDGVIDMTRRHSSFLVDGIDLTSKDRATVSVTMILPDFDSVDTDSLVDNIPFDVEDFLAYAADKGYDQDAFLAMEQSAGEDLIFEYMRSAGYMSGVIDSVLKSMDENVTTDRTPVKFSLRRVGGKWKITGESGKSE